MSTSIVVTRDDLALDLATGATTLRVGSGQGAKYDDYLRVVSAVPVRADDEAYWVTGRSGDDLTVSPGQQGTTPEAHVAGAAKVERVWTPGVIEALLLPDQVAARPSLRSLGTGATQAAVGNHAHAGMGSVTSVGLTAPADFSVSGSPVTTSGTLALTWASVSAANRVFASPTGGAGVPGFRSLVPADMPGVGSVTSVALAAPAELTVSGSPVTASGTLTLAWATVATANKVFASPSGSGGTPAFRALVAADVIALDLPTVVRGFAPLTLTQAIHFYNQPLTLTNLDIAEAGGVTVPRGGLTVTAGGLTVTAGGLTVTAGGITVNGTTATDFYSQLLYIDQVNSRVGFGGTTPGVGTPKFFVKTPAANAIQDGLVLENPQVGLAAGTGVHLGLICTGNWVGQIKGVFDDNVGNSSLRLAVGVGGTATEKLRIDATNWHIGTATAATATAGGVAKPATYSGFFQVRNGIAGTLVKIPFYAN